MHVQARSAEAQGSSDAPSSTRTAARRRDTALGQAQPVMGQGEAGAHPLGSEPIPIAGGLSFDDEPRIRRRTTSGSPATATVDDGWHELAVLKSIAEKIRRVDDAGANQAEKELRRLGCDRELIDELIGCHHASLRAQRALAGGCKPSPAQRAQAFALCVFDVNRWMWDRSLLDTGGEGEAAPGASGRGSRVALSSLVRGAKRLESFDGLQPTLELWSRLRLNPRGSEWNVMWFTLANHTGLFETNARRLLRAYAEAMAMAASAPRPSSASSALAEGDADFRQYMRTCLLKQWLTGPGEQERKALDRMSCEATGIFHRRLMQQFALLCGHFGQPLPPMVELILVDDESF